MNRIQINAVLIAVAPWILVIFACLILGQESHQNGNTCIPSKSLGSVEECLGHGHCFLEDRCMCFKGRFGKFCRSRCCSQKITTIGLFKHKILQGEEDMELFGDEANPVKTLNISSSLMDHVVAIEIGNSHLLILTENGSVFSLGVNAYGQLGIGNHENKTIPTMIQFPLENLETERAEEPFIVNIAVGSIHNLALSRSGTLYAFGANFDGQLGIGQSGTDIPYSTTPVEIPSIFFSGKKIVGISAGPVSGFAITEDGEVFGWGFYDYPSPSKIDTHGHRIVKISTGLYHTIALSTENRVLSWGSRMYGALGDQIGFDPETEPPLPIAQDAQEVYVGEESALSEANTTIIDISAGVFRSLLLSDDGRVFTFGLLDPRNGSYTAIARKLEYRHIHEKNETITFISSRGGHAIFISNAGRVYGFGDNSYLQLGITETSDIEDSASQSEENDIELEEIDYPYFVPDVVELPLDGMKNYIYASTSQTGTALIEGRLCGVQRGNRCFSRRARAGDVCSGVGVCVAPNECECLEGSYGRECENFFCYGRLNNDTSRVCSGNGVCIGINKCRCSKNYEGLMCNVLSFNGSEEF